MMMTGKNNSEPESTAIPTSTETAATMADSSDPPLVSMPPSLGKQWDSLQLDEYLYSLLWTKFVSSFDPLLEEHNNSSSTKSLLRSLSRALITAATLLMTQTQSPGVKSLGLRSAMAATNYNNPQLVKWKYIFLAAIAPFGYQLLQQWMIQLQEQILDLEENSNASPEEEEKEEQVRIARQRRYQVLRTIVRGVEQGLPMLKLGFLLSVLAVKPGKDNSASSWWIQSLPSLTMALSGLQYTTAPPLISTNTGDNTNTETTTSNYYSSDDSVRLHVLYAHRRWLYEESIQTLRIVFSPLLGLLRDTQGFLSTLIQRLMLQTRHQLLHIYQGQPFLAERCTGSGTGAGANINNSSDAATTPSRSSDQQSCAICGTQPIAIPYETDAPCDHIFCYVCLWNAASARSRSISSSSSSRLGSFGFPCPICRANIRISRPLVPLRGARTIRGKTVAKATDNSNKDKG